MIISSKVAIPSNTGTVISSGIEKTKELPPNFEEDAAIGPFLRVIEAGVVKYLSHLQKNLLQHSQTF